MTETTYEEAKRCPKCEFPGVKVGEEAIRKEGIQRGTSLHRIVCMNERCKWYGTTCRVIQVNPDGSIPPALLKRDKAYPAIVDRTAEVNAMVERQLRLETSADGTAEINR